AVEYSRSTLMSSPRRAKTKAPGEARGLFENTFRRRPTLPHTCARSTIGAGGLNCRVRNGNGCFPPARVTGKGKAEKNRTNRIGCEAMGSAVEERESLVKPDDRLVQVSSTPCSAYTSCLSTWSSSRGLQGDLISGGASRLDAFSGYPFRT